MCAQPRIPQQPASFTFAQASNDDETQAAAVAWIVRWLLLTSDPPVAAKGRLPLSDILACAGTK